ncbi:sigma-70 family RNA polymerase sigma factor [Nakamurella deserti]|uniref:sigma-70 family RNA polymerase sigma factor n=1 Tax=Nakamurella deserti TaxID=2164074 RepID=UPI000DBE987D
MSDVDAAPANDLTLARAGDDDAFTRLVAPLRPELHAHCYRLLGSAHDADDALQDALLRAWRGVAGFESRSSWRTWMYTVVTRVCLDALRGRSRRALPMDLGPPSAHPVLDDRPATGTHWLEPYAVAGLGEGPLSPAARYEQREAVEVAFVAAVSHLPPNQRAVLVLFDVLGMSAAEIADVVGTSVPAVTSALQRARRVVAERVPPRSQQQTLRQVGDGRVRSLVEGFAAALEQGDVPRLTALLTADVTWSMPPLPRWYGGRTAAVAFAAAVPMATCGAWRHRAVTANGQPAVAGYLCADGSGVFRAWAVTVLTVDGGLVGGITSFLGVDHFPRFGLPTELR